MSKTVDIDQVIDKIVEEIDCLISGKGLDAFVNITFELPEFKHASASFRVRGQKEGDGMAQFKKGDWFKYSDRGNAFCQITSMPGGGHNGTYRVAGQRDRDLQFASVNMKAFIPVSLEPDFSNTKIGDKCFSPEFGNAVVYDKKSNIINIDFGNHGTVAVHTIDCKHPVLFNSFAQFIAYWAEWRLTNDPHH